MQADFKQMLKIIDENHPALYEFPKNKGILPDYEIKPTLNDLIEGKDIVMDYVYELLEDNY